MSGGEKNKGFTLVEIMMFLAVTGVLFLIAMGAINGKQSQAEFAAGVRDFNQQIQGVISSITNGYFPENTNFHCQYSGIPGTRLNLTISATSGGQGAHPDCVFLGKVLYFDLRNTGVLPTSFSIITVAGGAANDYRKSPNSYGESHPSPLAGVGSATDLTEQASISNGLVVTKIISHKSAINFPSSFGVFTSLSQSYSGTTSGSLTANLVSIPGSSTSDRFNDVVKPGGLLLSINSLNNEPDVNPEVAVCLAHGAGGKKAAIIIGTKDRQIYSEIHIADADTAVQYAVSGVGGPVCP